ncbi:MAG: oligosaccharide flippase family protein [Candidatus Krumholzibacteriota bacterium]|nr:oligosaccharide flippase family protein [Candidatus Krumholzibacteriota bacterium]
MTSLTKRTVILVICRVLNYGVLRMLSPIFFARIFDVTSYGQYREFILYFYLIAMILVFSVNTNLIYFIPKHPHKERESVTNTAVMLFILSLVGVAAVYGGRNLILSRTSYDFVKPLIIYIFLFINFQYFESYCLGRKRADHVLYYSASHTLLQMMSIIIVAYITRSVKAVIWTLVIFEACRCLFVILMSVRLITPHIDRELLREQLRYIVPLGTSSGITRINTDLARVVVSTTLGADMLAIYSIGNYQVPIINMVRASLMDVLFPEMTQANEKDRITLWKRATVVLCAVVFPVFTIFLYFSRTVIVTLFTTKYLMSVPLFRIYLFLMPLQCFDLASPLRAMNRNKYFVLGNVLHLVTNIGLILILFRPLGIIAPALAYVIGILVFSGFLARKMMSIYQLSFAQLAMWNKIFKIVRGVVLTLPILLASRLVVIHDVAEAMIFSGAYLVIYFVIMVRSGVDEIDLMVSKLTRRLKRS